ncbi:MAG: ABC transporter ATP-binding protein/permease [Eubacteriales bacterium]
MLLLKNIKKDYSAGDSVVHALKGVSLEFGKSEFVCVLGPSGCGKTTLLNIIGGLDRYTDGGLYIGGRPTKGFKDGDWDSYRNSFVGFVFQSYNLIPHQSVTSNVALSLALSGVPRAEAKKRAAEALVKVGLGDKLKKKPNMLSGGQMQRVAIARALVNNPDIILADEPTGSLDSETSTAVMDTLKEISREKLVIMVTHNSSLAEKYATRVITLLDGEVTGDEKKPPAGETTKPDVKDETPIKKHRRMSMFTALSLSLQNLMTKKGRAAITSFAGSIGIIGIALIMALSNGIQLYIDRVQEDMLSSYPLRITEDSVDLMGLLQTLTESQKSKEDHPLDAVYPNPMSTQLLSSMASASKKNNLSLFKKYLEEEDSPMTAYASTIQYSYDLGLNIYAKTTGENGEKTFLKVNPSDIISKIRDKMIPGAENHQSFGGEETRFSVWTEMIEDEELLGKQYDVIAGKFPTSYDEVVLVVNENNELNDIAMYALGIKDPAELDKAFENGEDKLPKSTNPISYEEILSKTFVVVKSSDFFVKDYKITREDGDFWVWKDMSGDNDFVKSLVYGGDEGGKETLTLKIVGIIRPSENVVATSITGAIGYTSALAKKLIDSAKEGEIAVQQFENPKINVLTGLEFNSGEITMEDVLDYISTLPEQQKQAIMAYISILPEAQVLAMFKSALSSEVTYETVCAKIGVIDLDKPMSISIYAKTFGDKDGVIRVINEYNQLHEGDGNAIQYTDYVGLFMSSLSTFIQFVSYALIAFVSISLAVSSIMIGIITYVSVLERTKEIGILRAIGASKRDVSRVFNAETLILGFAAGVFGILFTLVLTIPLNLIIFSLSDISNIASLPPAGGAALVAVSMLLTFVAGLIPAKMASKKDPVVALRTE